MRTDSFDIVSDSLDKLSGFRGVSLPDTFVASVKRACAAIDSFVVRHEADWITSDVDPESSVVSCSVCCDCEVEIVDKSMPESTALAALIYASSFSVSHDKTGDGVVLSFFFSVPQTPV